MTTKIIPKDVYDAINDPHGGFDKMYYRFVTTSKTNKEAFEKSVDRMQDYFPNWSWYSTYTSYIISRNKRYRDKK